MINDIVFREDSVQIVEQVDNGKHAILCCVEPLLRLSCVTKDYADAMIHNVEAYGSSFIVSPYVVLPHAKPEQGVLQNAISILITRKPFHFHDPTVPLRLMIVLAPVDSKSHLKMLRDIAKVLNDEAGIADILESRREVDVYNRFVNFHTK